MDVAIGSKISVEITKNPTNDAARKTLIRLYRKDAAVARHHRMQQAKRPSWESWRRGGKMWHHQMRSKPAITLAPGQKFSLRATIDIVRDLESISRFVKVAKA